MSTNNATNKKINNSKPSNNNSEFTKTVEKTETELLMNYLENNKKKNIDKALTEIEDNFIDESESKKNFSYYLRDKTKLAGMKQKDVSYLAGFSIKYGEKVFMGSKVPSRDAVIRLAFVLKLDVKETNRALKYANRQPLYPKYKRDAAIIMLLNDKQNYQIFEINDKLNELGLEPLEKNLEI